MKNNRNDNRSDRNRDTEPRWLHEQQHGENSRRGNYTIDSHFNRGYGEPENDYRDTRSFNTNTGQRFDSDQGRYQRGGANSMGEDFNPNPNTANPYGTTFTRDTRYNSGRHYDPRADYSNRDYDSMRRNNPPRERFGTTDERFGHEVSRGGQRDEQFLGHSSIGDYESYRRYERDNRRYDNDYSGGFAGRNYSDDRDQFGEDRNLGKGNRR